MGVVTVTRQPLDCHGDQSSGSLQTPNTPSESCTSTGTLTMGVAVSVAPCHVRPSEHHNTVPPGVSHWVSGFPTSHSLTSTTAPTYHRQKGRSNVCGKFADPLGFDW